MNKMNQTMIIKDKRDGKIHRGVMEGYITYYCAPREGIFIPKEHAQVLDECDENCGECPDNPCVRTRTIPRPPMKNEALEPCPFCGGKSEIRNTGMYFYPLCTALHCGADLIGRYDTEAEAIQAWNRRASAGSARDHTELLLDVRAYIEVGDRCEDCETPCEPSNECPRLEKLIARINSVTGGGG